MTNTALFKYTVKIYRRRAFINPIFRVNVLKIHPIFSFLFLFYRKRRIQTNLRIFKVNRIQVILDL